MTLSLKFVFGPLCYLLWTGGNLAWAQNFSCESLEQYVDEHPECSIYSYYEPCFGIRCSDYNGSSYIYSRFYVQRCQDPVTVYVSAGVSKDGRYYYISHEFDQSETVAANGYYYGYDYHYHDHRQNMSTYTAILDRNSSHLGFEMYIESDGEEDVLWLFNLLYIPLFPAKCMCSAMENVAAEIHYRTNYDCTTSDDCKEIRCTVRHSILQSINFIVNSCEKSVDVELHMEGNEITTVHAQDNTTETIDSLGVDLIIDLWHFDYSVDVEIIAFSSIVPHIILRRQKIILDLTECGSHPIDISGDFPVPTGITQPTAPNASATMCEALKAISIEDGGFCSVDKACGALECQIGDHRLEIAMESCHHPPGITVEMYDSANQRLFRTSFNNGANTIHDKNLPFNLNVSIQQLLSNRVCVEIARVSDGFKIPIIPKWVIPIDNSSCFNPTSAPSTTCDAMEYIMSALAQSPQGVSCYYPIPHNCAILSCPIAVGEDITIQLLPCAQPPAVRVTVGNGFFTYFNHTFDHFEVISLDHDGVKQEVSVTLDQKPNQVGFQMDINHSNIVPYTIIPVNTTECNKPLESSGSSSSTVIATAVVVPVVVILLIVAVIVIITSVYLRRRRHIREKAFWNMAMSEVALNKDQ